ncbi:MAG: ATP synthase F0 subunit B [Desulfobacterales bacterium]|nr:ATP synthase F0 subunit B [Desulfobacterales bacterium]
MRFPVFSREGLFTVHRTAAVLAAALMLFCFAGGGLSSTGGEQGTEHAAGGEQGTEHAAPPSKGWQATDTYKVMNFAVLAVALVFLLRKPVKQALADRIQSIKNQLSELEAQKAAAEAELAKYNQRFQKLDQEAEKLIAQYVQQGEEAKARILKEAETAADKLQEQARRNIEHEFKKARQELQDDVLEKALAKAEEMVRDRISDGDQERLVDDYLSKVVA